MKSILYLFFLSCWMLASHFLNAQVKMEGAFTLGDTTQIHILTTTNGNVLEGRVIGFDQEKVLFLLGNDATLTFPIAQVRSIKVKGTPASEQPPGESLSIRETEPPSHNFPDDEFIYQASEHRDQDIIARLESYGSGAFRFKTATGQLEIINKSELISLKLSSRPLEGAGSQGQKLHVLYTKKRGDRFVGQVLSADDNMLEFQTQSGAFMRLLLKDVENIRYQVVQKKLKDEIDMQAQSANGYDRLFVTQSAFSSPKNVHEYRNYDLFYNGVNFGISDHVNAEIGLVPLIFLNIGHLNLKFTGDLSENLHLGVGGQATGIQVILDEAQTIGTLYGVATMGPRERYINLAAGKGNTNYSGAFTVYSIGGATEIGSKLRLTGEYIRISQPREQHTVFNALLQFVGKKMRFEAGVMALPNDSTGIPLIGFHLVL